MTEEIKFQACQHLIFDASKIDDRCKMKKLPCDLGVYWERPEAYPGAPTQVQFCSLRGRLNSKTAGISINECCSSYSLEERVAIIEKENK